MKTASVSGLLFAHRAFAAFRTTSRSTVGRALATILFGHSGGLAHIPLVSAIPSCGHGRDLDGVDVGCSRTTERIQHGAERRAADASHLRRAKHLPEWCGPRGTGKSRFQSGTGFYRRANSQKACVGRGDSLTWRDPGPPMMGGWF